MLVSLRNNNVNFTSTPLYEIRLPKADGSGFVDAVVSMLDPHNAEDIAAIEKIKQTWKDTKRILNHIYEAFVEKNSSYEYNAIELKEGSLEDRIVALSAYEINCRNASIPKLNLSYLVVKPELTKSGRTIKNIGEALFGFVVDVAKEISSFCLSFDSKNNGFYQRILEKAGISRPELNGSKNVKVSLYEQDILDFWSHWQQKFQPMDLDEFDGWTA
ncbi:MAG: hypothetical protein PHC64_01045 [Candidatus Gastranaerophilales bacterium]|nr:hypothetical protein [Candidatus Gastranaerophilales bacterium]